MPCTNLGDYEESVKLLVEEVGEGSVCQEADKARAKNSKGVKMLPGTALVRLSCEVSKGVDGSTDYCLP